MPTPAAPADPDGLMLSLAPSLRAWLPRQRWFAGKDAPLAGLALVAATELPTRNDRHALHHLLLRTPAHGCRGSEDTERPAPCYQLLVAVDSTPHGESEAGTIGRVERGPLAGRFVHDALCHPHPAATLFRALRTGARVGPLRFERDPLRPIGTGLRPRPLFAEQSNSSVVYGESLILKMFRRVSPGTHPDLELPRALARTGCPRVPAPAAWMTAHVEAAPWTLGVLQPYLRDATDGWDLAVRGPTEGDDFTEEARALGRATAEVHRSLARALPTVVLGPDSLRRLASGMSERLHEAVRTVPALEPYASGLRAAFTSLDDLALSGGSRTAQRVHGDLHLGQCLRAPSGHWSLIDFEGEPDRPLVERRLPQPAVRDVAGMLRSFDYAHHATEGRAASWSTACRASYCAGYAQVAGVDPRADPILLRACEADKAVYEVLYEARHRPDWLPVPIAAARRLASCRHPG
ncbi:MULTISPECIES: maltokinase N-terminal cap-like domain-containing protein [unclassified Streptomyces]|uniref:maltokinase N-terminal cap-like domain-containing protein n=1 Tax=unclassified Streptomyces TaxID=2593676 RepID=UPI001908289D|nr:phosphotransferase [Streptomyces sp. HSG2]